MSGGRAPRQKGNRAERALVRYLQDRGFAAERVPLSGSAGGPYVGDLTVPVVGVDRPVEVNVRAGGFSRAVPLARGPDFLIVRADRSEPLVVIPLKLAAEIAAGAERADEPGRGARPAPNTSSAERAMRRSEHTSQRPISRRWNRSPRPADHRRAGDRPDR